VDLMRRLHPLPGIALTGYGMESDVAKSREAGFLAHLTKPVDPGRLEGLIRQVAGAASGPE
jgi:CheY-like chemotaxis protein